MTVLYVAGPMTGLPEYNYPAFDTAEATLLALGYEVRNPTRSELRADRPEPTPWQWYVRAGLLLLLEADAVATLPNWECSRGARLEVDVAHGLGMQVLPLQSWMRLASGPER